MTYEDAEHFLNRCNSWLLERSDILNTLYACVRLVAKENPAFNGPYWFGAIEDHGGDIVACGNHCLPDGLNISELPKNMIGIVHDSIVKSVGLPHRIMAPQYTAEMLAKRFSEASIASTRFHHRLHTYRLDNLVWPAEEVPGRLRKGHKEEEDLIAEWGRAYGEEESAPVDVSDFFLRKRSDGDLYIWDQNGARTILTLSGGTDKSIRISAVYTPPEFRGRGYASAAVAELSQTELNKGREFVVLFVIDGSPSARLYQRLGYRLIGSRDCFLIDK